MSMRSIPATILVAVFVVACATLAHAITLEFDDLPGDGATYIPTGYGGLQWDNWGTDNCNSFSPTNSGFANAAVSPYNSAYNANGNQAEISGSPFTFGSAYFTAAWNDGLNVQIVGRLNGIQVESANFTVNTSGPTLETFNWPSIDTLIFTSAGGVQHPGYYGAGSHFAMDNFTYTVPEPSTLALLGMGAFGLLAYVWRGRKRGHH